jgi:hypothetical protein
MANGTLEPESPSLPIRRNVALLSAAVAVNSCMLQPEQRTTDLRRCADQPRRARDVFNTFYQLLDRAPKGRDEDNIPAGEWWWRRHDEYEGG